jgi:tRNA A-37 threonylcarbamoyl transferase component Bud32
VSHQLFALFHRDWYESFERYQSGEELLRIVRAALPLTWRLCRQACWFSAFPPAYALPRQGWKIHISATPTNCEEILRQAATFCIEQGVAFKFSLDIFCLQISTSALWTREGSGKFITIYPLNESHFCQVMEGLYHILRRFEGPYILSDKRYKDAGVLFYRYGGIAGRRQLSVSGEQKLVLLSPQGELVPDQRTPYWNPPEWVHDPFTLASDDTANAEEPDCTLKGGRYCIQEALRLSVDGGVYLATDTHCMRQVIIKEARPAVHIDARGKSATDRLEEEYRLLLQLRETGITPVPIDLFWDWEHLFLVEEYIAGLELNQFVVRRLPLIKTDPERHVILDYAEKLTKIWSQLARAIAMLHEQGIIYGDLSLKNIIVCDDEQGTVRLVDLESAWQEKSGSAAHLGTPGFSNPALAKLSGKRQDIYAFGSVLLGTLFPINTLLTLDPTVAHTFLQAACRDLGLPPELSRLIEDCISEDAAVQPALRQAIEVIQQARLQMPEKITLSSPVERDVLLDVIDQTIKYIHASADYARTDRLFPADPAVFSTNPLSMAYGAAGVTYAIVRIEGTVPGRMRTWLLSQDFHQDHLPPGLYVGLAGIAWAFWEMDLPDVAIQILHRTWQHPLLWDAADVFSGAAGYGLACLRFALATNDTNWLEYAQQIGAWLLRTKKECQEGYYWPYQDGTIHSGYARGQVALDCISFILA